MPLPQRVLHGLLSSLEKEAFIHKILIKHVPGEVLVELGGWKLKWTWWPTSGVYSPMRKIEENHIHVQNGGKYYEVRVREMMKEN